MLAIVSCAKTAAKAYSHATTQVEHVTELTHVMSPTTTDHKMGEPDSIQELTGRSGITHIQIQKLVGAEGDGAKEGDGREDWRMGRLFVHLVHKLPCFSCLLPCRFLFLFLSPWCFLVVAFDIAELGLKRFLRERVYCIYCNGDIEDQRVFSSILSFPGKKNVNAGRTNLFFYRG